MKEPFSWRRLLCGAVQHRLFRSGVSDYNGGWDACPCGRMWPR